MFLRCPCGHILNDVASPGCVTHLLLSDHGVETLENEVDREVNDEGKVDMWPEHFEKAGAINTWLCPKCHRLFLRATGDPRKVVVYRREDISLTDDSSGIDTQFAPEDECIAHAMKHHTGRSPLESPST